MTPEEALGLTISAHRSGEPITEHVERAHATLRAFIEERGGEAVRVSICAEKGYKGDIRLVDWPDCPDLPISENRPALLLIRKEPTDD